MESGRSASKLGLVLRVGFFVFLSIVGLWIFPPLMYPIAGYLIAAGLGTFTTAAVANALVLRIYERGQLADIGMQWSKESRRNLLVGLVGGLGAACLVLGPPLLTGFAELRPDPENSASLGSFFFVYLVLMFGAIGEEMLFRGYGFQILLGRIGPFATILPVSVLFGLSHSSNQSATPLALINTVGWGIILGVAFLRSGDLWLPIGLHLSWNWALPLFGVNLSGFTIGITGYSLQWMLGDIWSGGAYGPEGGILTSLALVVLAFYLWKAPIHGQSAFLLKPSNED